MPTNTNRISAHFLRMKIRQKPARGPGGRPPYDVVLMFKVLVLQHLYNLADKQTE